MSLETNKYVTCDERHYSMTKPWVAVLLRWLLITTVKCKQQQQYQQIGIKAFARLTDCDFHTVSLFMVVRIISFLKDKFISILSRDSDRFSMLRNCCHWLIPIRLIVNVKSNFPFATFKKTVKIPQWSFIQSLNNDPLITLCLVMIINPHYRKFLWNKLLFMQGDRKMSKKGVKKFVRLLFLFSTKFSEKFLKKVKFSQC